MSYIYEFAIYMRFYRDLDMGNYGTHFFRHYHFLRLLEFQQGYKGMMFFYHYPFRNTKLHQSPFCLCSVFVRLKDCAFSVSKGTSSV